MDTLFEDKLGHRLSLHRIDDTDVCGILILSDTDEAGILWEYPSHEVREIAYHRLSPSL